MRQDYTSGTTNKATTSHKVKPDGTRELTHSVEHSVPEMMRRATHSTPKRKQHESNPLHSGRLHRAVIDGHTGNDSEGMRRVDDFNSTAPSHRQLSDEIIAMLRDAFMGDGNLERPAPGGSIDYGGIAPEPMIQPEPTIPSYGSMHRLVPHYIGGARPASNV